MARRRYKTYQVRNKADSIVWIVYIFILYTFIVVITYFALSVPANALFDAFGGADFALAQSEINSILPNLRQAFVFAMALMIACPVTWFVMKIFSREPAYYSYRRY